MRFYTVEEARAILPAVIEIVERVRQASLELRTMRATQLMDIRGASGDGQLLANPWAADEGEDSSEAPWKALENGSAELEALGIEIKDADRGLIDFYSSRDGEAVYLCYLLGEPELAYWHSLEDGFAGRRPL